MQNIKTKILYDEQMKIGMVVSLVVVVLGWYFILNSLFRDVFGWGLGARVALAVFSYFVCVGLWSKMHNTERIIDAIHETKKRK